MLLGANPGGPYTVLALIVGGGGGGGGGYVFASWPSHYQRSGGGGGAGGTQQTSNIVIPETNYTVTVGSGGTGQTTYNVASAVRGTTGGNYTSYLCCGA